jgi:tetratricopeptide (TPR) repeat protein
VTRAELDDERTFLLTSLEDLEAERAAGDLSESDYAALRDRYTRRAAEVLRALDDAPGAPEKSVAVRPAPSAAPLPDGGGGAPRWRGFWRRRSPRRRAMAVAGILVLVVALSTLVVTLQAGTRLPGETGSGSVTLSPAQQEHQTLLQAEALEASGDASEAVALYRQVLARDPTQAEALSESGWLEFEAGVQAKDAAVLTQAQQLEERAQRVDPGDGTPHLYLGSMLLSEGDPAGAVTQYSAFLGDHPPVREVEQAAPFITRAFTDAGRPVPALPGAAPTATSAPAPTATG